MHWVQKSSYLQMEEFGPMKNIRSGDFFPAWKAPFISALDKTTVDSAFLIWPDNSYQAIQLSPLNTVITFSYQKGLPNFDYTRLRNHWKNETRPVEDITAQTNILYKHKENAFHEFDREPLIPHMFSTEGPALTVADFNHDSLEDVFIGSSRRGKSAVFLQQKSGKFLRTEQPGLEADSNFEFVASCVADVNNDGFPDLVVANGGNEFYGTDEHLRPRIYLNDGKGIFTRDHTAFDSLFINASSIVSLDFNGDGYTDLFIGGRSVPFLWTDSQILPAVKQWQGKISGCY